MAISVVSPLGNTSYYSSFKADTAPAQSQPAEQGKTPASVGQEKHVDENQGPGREQGEAYTTYQRIGGGTPAMGEGEESQPTTTDDSTKENDASAKSSETKSGQRDSEYSPEEQKQISNLKARDTEVKAHEQAHIAAGGQYVRGGAHFEYQTGPDGKKYAVGGEVSIDASKEPGDPKATIAKMRTIIRAATAPANPSGQDRAVAANASRIEMEAQSEVMALNQTEENGNSQNSGIKKGSHTTDGYTASMDEPSSKPTLDVYT
ncbi:MAG: SprA-related family protein [Proteobacteria bacterium]|nr:SprA-related family protein [Pseudomonadota bacterium]